MKTKILSIAFILFASLMSVHAGVGGEDKVINKERVEIIKELLKTEILKDKPVFRDFSNDEFVAFEARIVEDGTIKIEALNCSNPIQGAMLRKKLENIIIYNPSDVAGSIITMKFKYILK